MEKDQYALDILKMGYLECIHELIAKAIAFIRHEVESKGKVQKSGELC